MWSPLTDPVVIVILIALGILFTWAAFYLHNLDREARRQPLHSFREFVGACGETIMRFLDQWAPVFKTRTGAYSTIQQVLAQMGVVVAAPKLEIWTTVALCAALLYCWLRTIHGRKNASGPIEPAKQLDAAPPPQAGRYDDIPRVDRLEPFGGVPLATLDDALPALDSSRDAASKDRPRRVQKRTQARKAARKPVARKVVKKKAAAKKPVKRARRK